MSDLISRRDAIKVVMDKCKKIPSIAIPAKYALLELPPAQPERKTGQWEGTLLVKNSGRVKCSECYAIYAWDTQAKYFKFCPNCGADMRGEQDERFGL